MPARSTRGRLLRLDELPGVDQLIQGELDRAGRMDRAEKQVAAILLLTSLMYLLLGRVFAADLIPA